jgi:hypothetical protein
MPKRSGYVNVWLTEINIPQIEALVFTGDLRKAIFVRAIWKDMGKPRRCNYCLIMTRVL